MKEEQKKTKHCQYYYPDLASSTLPDTRVALPLRRHWWHLKRYIWNISILGILGFGSRRLRPMKKLRTHMNTEKPHLPPAKIGKDSNLKVGDWVRVRSIREIFATLDQQDKLLGLRFTPEMAKFCGKAFRIFKRIDKIIVETTGELRKIRTPTFLLEGVFCDGKAHGGCDRSCFCFWREAWLEEINSPTENEKD